MVFGILLRSAFFQTSATLARTPGASFERNKSSTTWVEFLPQIAPMAVVAQFSNSSGSKHPVCLAAADCGGALLTPATGRRARNSAKAADPGLAGGSARTARAFSVLR